LRAACRASCLDPHPAQFFSHRTCLRLRVASDSRSLATSSRVSVSLVLRLHLSSRKTISTRPADQTRVLLRNPVSVSPGHVAASGCLTALSFVDILTVSIFVRTSPSDLSRSEAAQGSKKMTTIKTSRSDSLFERAQQLMPGGVNSPVRAFRAVGRSPLFIQQAAGARITDADGNEYIDYVGSWGPMILGHAHPAVIQSIREAAGHGTSYGAPTGLEIELAERIIDAFPSIELVRLVSSGTEAAMSALRLARGFTGRDRIVKCEGCYHGHSDI